MKACHLLVYLSLEIAAFSYSGSWSCIECQILKGPSWPKLDAANHLTQIPSSPPGVFLVLQLLGSSMFHFPNFACNQGLACNLSSVIYMHEQYLNIGSEGEAHFLVLWAVVFDEQGQGHRACPSIVSVPSFLVSKCSRGEDNRGCRCWVSRHGSMNLSLTFLVAAFWRPSLQSTPAPLPVTLHHLISCIKFLSVKNEQIPISCIEPCLI